MKIIKYFWITVATKVVKRDAQAYDAEDYDPYGIPNESELSSKPHENCEKVCKTVCLPTPATTSTTFIKPKTSKSSEDTGNFSIFDSVFYSIFKIINFNKKNESKNIQK